MVILIYFEFAQNLIRNNNFSATSRAGLSKIFAFYSHIAALSTDAFSKLINSREVDEVKHSFRSVGKIYV